jgi:Histidine phosphatase superfamily (branch 1)
VLPLRRFEIRRHAASGSDLGGDALSPEGVEQAHRLGRSLRVGYTHLFSSGAQRATQTLACILAGMGHRVLNGVVIRPDLGTPREADWRAAVAAAGSSNLDALLRQDEVLVQGEAERLSSTLRSILAELPEGSYALAVGQSPLAECAIYGLTGQLPPPLKECEGFLIAEHKGGRLGVEEQHA